MALVKRSQPSQPSMVIPKEMADNYAKEYSELSAQIKKLEERKKIIANYLKNFASEKGVKDDKGSYYYENDNFIVGSVAKTKLVPRENIIELLKDMGREDCIEVLETANMTMIDKLHNEGTITDEQVASLYELKQLTPSISVTKKEEIPKVQQTKAALSKRRV